MITGVLIEQEGRWLIAAFQNTDIVPISLPASFDNDLGICAAKERAASKRCSAAS